MFNLHIPLSLYIHIPWCIKKCPYCDFNSHTLKGDVQEEIYVAALLQDLEKNLPRIQGRSLTSLFFGGGTPSLFSPQAIEAILEGIQQRLSLDPKVEITLEANPGTVEQQRFKDYRSVGVNRLSIGIQSLQDSKLKILGRIHDSDTAIRAVKTAQDGGFDNMNVDIMYGLPEQTTAEALKDIETALALQTTHLSWYQLTIEPNTAFFHQPPTLPVDDAIWEMQMEGQAIIAAQQIKQYEISAYSHLGRECQHNLNYWEFGDYLGIGAGAHSKLTDVQQQTITRHWQVKNPRDYLDAHKNKTAQQVVVTQEESVFEFMLNALRLTAGVPLSLFTARTGLSLEQIEPILARATAKNLLLADKIYLKPTELGKRFLNDLTSMFLPEAI